MKTPTIAILSFPGNNCEVESIRSIKRAGMNPVYIKWNDAQIDTSSIDGYFLPGGFSYEDRGRAGMIAALDPVMDIIRDEAKAGKPVIGNCNGAQILVESGLVPFGDQLQMSLARNVSQGAATGFLSEWIWITPSRKDICCTSNWDGVMQMPIAHGEGRFTTEDPDLLQHLQNNNQIAFTYCTAEGLTSDEPLITPNGSSRSIAGICNPAGNVVALMPHPERTPLGDPYFVSLKKWIETDTISEKKSGYTSEFKQRELQTRDAKQLEIFIDTLIVNNEERTVEKAGRSIAPSLSLKQLRYLSVPGGDPSSILQSISFFNPNKEVAYIRKNGAFYKWNADTKSLDTFDGSILNKLSLLRRDVPDTISLEFGSDAESGVCYSCDGITCEDLTESKLQTIFGNPHASILEFM